jgi:uncharacterized protein YndB with AHSA1/START domain
MSTLPGEIVRVGDESQLRFDRTYRYGIEDVWSAIATPERCRRWLGDLIDAGWVFPGEPPTRLRVTLTEDGPDRTRVIMEHTFPAELPITRLPGYGTGWHHFVDSLDAYLGGRELPEFGDYYPALLDDWRAALPR